MSIYTAALYGEIKNLNKRNLGRNIYLYVRKKNNKIYIIHQKKYY